MNLSTITGRFKYRVIKKLRNIDSKYIVTTPIRAFTNNYKGNNMIDHGSILRDCNLGEFSYVSYDSYLQKTQIGKFCSIGPRVYTGFSTHPTKNWITTHPAFYLNLTSFIGYSFHKDDEPLYNIFKETQGGFLCEIGNDVWIGADVKIMDGVKIGDGAIIAAGAVVTTDVEPYAIVGGVPAKLIRKRFEDNQIVFLKEFKWWNKPISWIMTNYRKFNNIDAFMKEYNNLD